ncbi:putative exo-beta-1,3-glucanase [Penicillium oxalicum 114-2]|uniref:Putative exo-beta-1,3-glucanase n=1 Tax=Penicillium oxalicum (strain 114-2 / CGMCC 5302) TaxID=933388 RepID=S8B1J2_PENO1|nr:putative exo-beta-1,3-glucanase [Penicillium oxalicum 114-2]
MRLSGPSRLDDQGLLPLIIVLLITIICCVPVQADHSHFHRRHLHHKRDNHKNTTDDENALAVLREVNKHRTEYPNFNQKAFSESRNGTREPAQPLDYSPDAIKTARLQARDSSANETSGNRPYLIPPELAKAARIVAESTVNKPTGDQPQVAAEIREKYGKGQRHTNTPPQALVRSNGLYNYLAFGSGGDTSDINDNKTIQEQIQKRDGTSKYWMASVNQNGQSPFASSGYKVWRNVRDYGAAGDGVTDDTEAINRAFFRWREMWLWFPAGTYLVSSPIIQYYNTEFLGDPLNVPTIFAASSFVGLGVITSDVYVSDNGGWYVNQNNFLRSVRNFRIDIRPTDPLAYICAIHWQVAQGTSLENIEFYMLYNSDVPSNTQQGIYMENGSGGFLADLTFVGGNFGAYFGNQQFTSSQLDYVIESCTNGLIIVGGAGGPGSTGQGVGSLVLADAIIANTPNGIITSLYAENSTSLFLKNVGFFKVKTAIIDSVKNQVLLAGGNEVLKDAWGFGMITDAGGQGSFVSGQDILKGNMDDTLLGTQAYVKSNLFTRRRPQYESLTARDIVNVKDFGAKGDGTTDDTVVLNNILSYAANLSSVVYFPFGVYKIHDTLRVPVGSRIIGQAWSQIMATGAQFSDVDNPHVAVQVGAKGDVGIVEIQDMLFTVSGPTAGVVLVEWNVEQSVKGSAAMWDSHIRIGGAIGSQLQKAQCPKQSDKVNSDCIAASLLLHLTPSSTAYMENIWVWVADHDLDESTQDQIDVYAARGILIESQLAWLYGTASEHSTLYQYQLSGARRIVMGMIQTESPYYQPVPLAPAPFKPGKFPHDPTFANCDSDSVSCAVSWALRIVDSASIWILGSGLYSWYSDYSQTCLNTNSCQQRAFEFEQSVDLWIYNLCTRAIVEMVTPFQGVPTYAKDNLNGLLSSMLVWIGGLDMTIGERKFPGWSIYTSANLENLDLPDSCRTSLVATIKCDSFAQSMMSRSWHGSLGNDTLTDLVCDTSCGESLRDWFTLVQHNCAGYKINDSPPELYGGRVWAGYNETCMKDKNSDKYCNAVIDGFTLVQTTEEMPQSEICSHCYTTRLQMMQQTPYSMYDDYYQGVLETINKRRGLSGPTDILEIPWATIDEEPDFCLSEKYYTTVTGDTCTSIAEANSISSASLYMGNQKQILSCSSMKAGLKLCLPPTCEATYSLEPSDNCTAIETAFSLSNGDLRKYNPWISFDCDNLQVASKIYGKKLCLSPPGGTHTNATAGTDSTTPTKANGYVYNYVAPPSNASLAEGTTQNCGRWHEAVANETCVGICGLESITHGLFVMVNPSLNSTHCSESLQIGKTYCAGPMYTWNDTLTNTGSGASAS